MLSECQPSVCNTGSALRQHCVNVFFVFCVVSPSSVPVCGVTMRTYPLSLCGARPCAPCHLVQFTTHNAGCAAIPENTRHLPTVGSMLVHRLRRRPSTKPTLSECHASTVCHPTSPPVYCISYPASRSKIVSPFFFLTPDFPHKTRVIFLLFFHLLFL